MSISYHIEDSFGRRLRQPPTAKMLIWVCHCNKNFIKVDIDNRRYQKSWTHTWHNIPFSYLTSGAIRLLDQCSKCGLTWWIVYDDPIKEAQSPERDFLSDLIVFEKDGLWQIVQYSEFNLLKYEHLIKCPFCDETIRISVFDVVYTKNPYDLIIECKSCKAKKLSREELEIHFVLAQNQSRF